MPDGSTFWYVNGALHSEDGPAYEQKDGIKQWFLHGKLHRIDGPAVEHANGIRRWFLNGEELDPIVHFLRVGELELDKF